MKLFKFLRRNKEDSKKKEDEEIEHLFKINKVPKKRRKRTLLLLGEYNKGIVIRPFKKVNNSVGGID